MDQTYYKALEINSFTCITSVCTHFHYPALSQKTDNNIYHWYHPLQTSVEKLENTFFSGKCTIWDSTLSAEYIQTTLYRAPTDKPEKILRTQVTKDTFVYTHTYKNITIIDFLKK